MAFSWAIVGPGTIAQKFAEALHSIPETRLHMVLGRDAGRARAFCARWADSSGHAPIATQSLDDVLGDARVDGVYIATPHPQHAGFIETCLNAGKPVLCEKPMVLDPDTAFRLCQLAQAKGVFLMEAMWTRFLPVYSAVGEWLNQGLIGDIRHIQSDFCFPAPYDPQSRLFAPDMAGGALYDVGVYNLAMTHWVLSRALGDCPDPIGVVANMVAAPTGVDMRINATLLFPEGIMAQFVCGLDCPGPGGLHILGTRGHIVVPANFWQGHEARLTRTDHEVTHAQYPRVTNGFEFEIQAAMDDIRAGRYENTTMAHGDTLAVARWDRLVRTAATRP